MKLGKIKKCLVQISEVAVLQICKVAKYQKTVSDLDREKIRRLRNAERVAKENIKKIIFIFSVFPLFN